ncbi:MAG: pilus assembly protein CpaF [Acidimicrobiales bacterium]
MSTHEQRLAEVLTATPQASRSLLAESVREVEPLIDGAVLHHLVERSWQRAHGLGPIADVLADPEVSEVMVNGPGPVWVDRGGMLEESNVTLERADIVLLIERILDPLGLRVDRSSPVVDARLADGSRVNVVMPPLAVEGPVLTIRRFAPRAVPLGAFGPAVLQDLLADLVRQRRTIVVSGGTATGKTTLLNAMGALLDPDERVVTIEDTAELQLPGRHVVRLEARPSNSEGVGAVTIRDLVRNALRMRPDRLVIGEVRGGEALDLLMALNTGHDGSLSTCHANHPGAALARLQTLALMGGVDVPADAIEAQLVEAVDVVVQVARVGSSRVVSEVAEVVPPTAGRSLGVRPIWRADSCSS